MARLALFVFLFPPLVLVLPHPHLASAMMIMKYPILKIKDRGYLSKCQHQEQKERQNLERGRRRRGGGGGGLVVL
jgi:hypothetical protein